MMNVITAIIGVIVAAIVAYSITCEVLGLHGSSSDAVNRYAIINLIHL